MAFSDRKWVCTRFFSGKFPEFFRKNSGIFLSFKIFDYPVKLEYFRKISVIFPEYFRNNSNLTMKNIFLIKMENFRKNSGIFPEIFRKNSIVYNFWMFIRIGIIPELFRKFSGFFPEFFQSQNIKFFDGKLEYFRKIPGIFPEKFRKFSNFRRVF